MAALPQGDLASIGFKKIGIGNQTGARGRGRRPAVFCPEQTPVLIDDIWPHNDLDSTIAIRRKQTAFHLFLDAALKTVAYLRVSTRSQDPANQKLVILEFSQKRRIMVDQFIESRISSRKSPLERRIDEMLETLQPGDRLLVSELSRLGRSLGQVIQIVETLVRRKIRFIAIKEAIEFDGKQDLRTKVMIALFGLFAEVERDLISERTKEGLAAAKAKGKLLGRPKGALGTSRGQLEPALEALNDNLGEHPDCVLADAGYRSESNLEMLEQRQIDGMLRWAAKRTSPPLPFHLKTLRLAGWSGR